MAKVIADPENEKHAALIKAAFGPKADVSVIQANVEKLRTDNIPVKLATAPGLLAATVYDKSTDPMVAQHVVFGETFHKGV